MKLQDSGITGLSLSIASCSSYLIIRVLFLKNTDSIQILLWYYLEDPKEMQNFRHILVFVSIGCILFISILVARVCITLSAGSETNEKYEKKVVCCIQDDIQDDTHTQDFESEYESTLEQSVLQSYYLISSFINEKFENSCSGIFVLVLFVNL